MCSVRSGRGAGRAFDRRHLDVRLFSVFRQAPAGDFGGDEPLRSSSNRCSAAGLTTTSNSAIAFDMAANTPRPPSWR